MTQALEILTQTFGFSEFRTPQQEVIDHLVDGEDALVLMPTGGGKSLCYQLPALLRPGPCCATIAQCPLRRSLRSSP